jgi:UDP-GlcNAc:undecaprenyl-phosphate GlcNAc-1-phosphate transferase
MFALGAIDDLRPLGPKLKLAIQIVATLPLLAAGAHIHGFLPAPLGMALTVLWIVLLTNSFNLLDNMDGLSASVALVVCLVLTLAAWQGGQFWMPALFLCLAGALGGFLLYNFHPASMFMGDSGSLTIGYLVSVFSILITYTGQGSQAVTGLPVLMPLAIMGVPLFDTLSVMFIRWRAGKPLMLGDRNHFSHRLLAMGFGVRGAALTIALLTGACGLLALPLRRLPLGQALIQLAGLTMLFGVVVALELTGRRGAAKNPPPHA